MKHHIEILITHSLFKNYIMKRNEKALNKRSEFIKWYLNVYQSSKDIRTVITDLSNILFVSKKTIEREIKKV